MTEIPEYLRLLWGGAVEERPGPKRTLDLRSIAAAGVRLADESGLAAVSMRNVAAQLGLTSMALYRYVGSKDDLITIVVDEAYGEPKPTSGTWRERLGAWARSNRAALQAHPWIMQVPITEPPLAPNQIAWMEEGLQSFQRTELTPQQKLSAMLLVNVYVQGQTKLGAGMTPEAGQLYSSRLRELVDPERFPEVARVGAADVDEFEFGLETVLDGIEALTRRR